MPRHRIATVILLSSTLATASPKNHTPPPDDKVPTQLLTLRTELHQLSVRDTTVGELGKFRALCDAEGYPLVGNIAAKGEDDRMQPSKACQLIRDRPASRSW